jgi:hypothetical protein
MEDTKQQRQQKRENYDEAEGAGGELRGRRARAATRGEVKAAAPVGRTLTLVGGDGWEAGDFGGLGGLTEAAAPLGVTAAGVSTTLVEARLACNFCSCCSCCCVCESILRRMAS